MIARLKRSLRSLLDVVELLLIGVLFLLAVALEGRPDVWNDGEDQP